jgi:hypothetical protein
MFGRCCPWLNFLSELPCRLPSPAGLFRCCVWDLGPTAEAHWSGASDSLELQRQAVVCIPSSLGAVNPPVAVESEREPRPSSSVGEASLLGWGLSSGVELYAKVGAQGVALMVCVSASAQRKMVSPAKGLGSRREAAS